MAVNTQAAHAFLSPSGAHRWLACTPSAMLETQYMDTGSEAAREGTLAHELAELKLLQNGLVYGAEKHSKKELTARHKAIKENPLYAPEMERFTDGYADFIKERSYQSAGEPFSLAEVRVDLSRWIPRSFGTVDFAMLAGEKLLVVDFKYGFTPVDADENPQLMLYAAGVLNRYQRLYDIAEVDIVIYQPRISAQAWSGCTLSAEHILTWCDSYVKERAALAMKGLGNYAPSDTTCQWCKAKGECQARARKMLEVFEETKEEQAEEPALLSPERKAEILRDSQGFVSWLKDLEAQALKDALAGKQIPGFKVVEGRSNRRITDEGKAASCLAEAGYDEALVYERKFLGLTALEKLTGKKELALILGGLIVKPKGRPTLAPESDRRAVFDPHEKNAKEIFGESKKGNKSP